MKIKNLKSRLKKLKVKDCIKVVWLDADGPGDPCWHDESVIDEWIKQKYLVHDIGYVMAVTDNHLAIVGGYSTEEDYVSQYHREVKIPLGCIISIKSVR